MELVNSIRVYYVAIKKEDLLYNDMEFFPKYAVKYWEQEQKEGEKSLYTELFVCTINISKWIHKKLIISIASRKTFWWFRDAFYCKLFCEHFEFSTMLIYFLFVRNNLLYLKWFHVVLFLI